jgi:tRNA (cmo5U34)-methyltransferase
MKNHNRLEAEKMTDFFDSRAGNYDEHMFRNVDHFEAFYAAIADPIPVTNVKIQILDLGCGTGLELETIFQRVPNAQVTGIDLSRNMLVLLRDKYAKRMPQIELIQGSYLDLFLGESRYDYVISVMTLHHLLPTKKFSLYQNIKRALKSGGKYIEADYVVSESKTQQFIVEYQKKFESGRLDGSYHLDIPMSSGTLKTLLTKAGFANFDIVWQLGEALVLEASKL